MTRILRVATFIGLRNHFSNILSTKKCLIRKFDHLQNFSMLGIKKWPSGTNFLSKQAIKSFNNGLKLKIMPKNIVEIISKIANLILTIKAELAQGWDFLEIPNARDFLFWARLKNPENPEIPGIGIGIWKSRKIPKKSRVKNPENPEIPGSGFCFRGMGYPDKKSPLHIIFFPNLS